MTAPTMPGQAPGRVVIELEWGVTIYPVRTPAGYPLAERLAARLEQARAGQATGANLIGLVFPSPTGKHWRASNFNRNVFCTTASLFTWKLDATDVSRMAGQGMKFSWQAASA